MTNRLEQVIEAEERRAEKVADLFDLLRDPDLADIVLKLIGGAQATALNCNGSGQSESPGGLRGVIRALGALPPKFTTVDVRKQLVSQHYDFKDADPKVAIRDALYTLSREGSGQAFRIVTPSRAGSLNEYERVPIREENQKPA